MMFDLGRPEVVTAAFGERERLSRVTEHYL